LDDAQERSPSVLVLDESAADGRVLLLHRAASGGRCSYHAEAEVPLCMEAKRFSQSTR
jgi:hypothetical protein